MSSNLSQNFTKVVPDVELERFCQEAWSKKAGRTLRGVPKKDGHLQLPEPDRRQEASEEVENGP